jgi:hypothetical protein
MGGGLGNSWGDGMKNAEGRSGTCPTSFAVGKNLYWRSGTLMPNIWGFSQTADVISRD